MNSRNKADLTTGQIAGIEAPAGEHRRAAVVWLLLEAPPAIDEELAFEAFSLIHAVIGEAVDRHDGRTLRRPDGFTILIGIPRAHEDDPVRAIQTAYTVQRELQALANHGRIPHAFRLGASYGPLVAGDINTIYHEEVVVTGATVGRASGLAEMAPAGEIWVDQAVAAAASHICQFEAVDTGSRIANTSLTPHRILSVREQPHPERGLPHRQSEMVGRDHALQMMQQLAEQLPRGQGGFIWIQGDAGIGKSRLMREFGGRLADQVQLWGGRCSAQHSGIPYALFSDLMIQACGIRASDSGAVVVRRIDETLARWPEEARNARPFVELMLGVSPSGQAGARLADLTPEQLRQQTFLAWRVILTQLAAQAPLVLLLDDIQWVDPMSSQLLLFLSGLVTAHAVLITVTERTTYRESTHALLRRVQQLQPDHTLHLPLLPLIKSDAQRLLDNLLAGASLPAATVDAILQRSAGNPYYLEEFVRTLLTEGILRMEGNQWTIDAKLAPEGLPLPSSLESLFRSRIDPLSALQKLFLQYGATLGPSFDAAFASRLSGCPLNLAHLEQLQELGLLAPAEGPGMWRFGHVLIESVVYETMLRARRRQLHSHVALSLEEQWADDAEAHAETLAYHYLRTDESSRALHYTLVAGERAVARDAHQEALSYFETAVELMGQLAKVAPMLRWRVICGAGDVQRMLGKFAAATAILQTGKSLLSADELSPAQRAGLTWRLGDAAQKQGDLPAAQAYYEDALQFLEGAREAGALVAATHAWSGIAWNHFINGELDQAVSAGEESLLCARQAGDLNQIAAASNVLGGIYYRLGDLEKALHHTDQARGIYETIGYTAGVAKTLNNLGILSIPGGAWNEAQTYFEQSLAIRTRIGDAEGMVIAYNNLGALGFDRGELERASNYFQQSLALAGPLKMAYHVISAKCTLAQVLLAQGRLDEARIMIDESLLAAQETGAQDLLPEVHRARAEILLADNRPDLALRAGHQSVALATANGNSEQAAIAWRVISQIALSIGQTEEANSAIKEARVTTGSRISELEAGRIVQQEGQLLLRAGQARHAVRKLTAAQGTFSRLGAARDLDQVDRLLSAVDGNASP